MSKPTNIIVWSGLILFLVMFLYSLIGKHEFDSQALLSLVVIVGIIGLDKYIKYKY